MIVSVNFILLLFAGAFFAILSFKNIYPYIIKKRSHAIIALFVTSCAGFIGGWLYGLIGLMQEAQLTGLPPSIISLSFGSFGGYWGVLAGIMIYGLFTKTHPLLLTDAMISGIIFGGSIARIADYFSESSQGIVLNISWAQWFQPFKPWFLYDIAALFVIQLLILKIPSRIGLKTIIFLIGYGSLRFTLEFIRDTIPLYEWITYGQLMAIIQVGFGLILYLKSDHNKEIPENLLYTH